ncbi:hypothetical protein BM607_009335 [Shewanella sp. SACH]|uniref:hypothetical protein n=1 Tax=Shewanella sp. SACH TaxID=1873135 RepID=UPI00090390E7|nr:hypothetical protein [Shewanella sp. SACH]OUS51450.1 hypothetical protein BM607_009335 [Shewanella sp. SACH]
MKKIPLLFLISTVFVFGCSNSDDDFSFEINQRDIEHSEIIKDAGSVLSQLCPPVKKANSVNASYQSDVVIGYESKNKTGSWGDEELDLTKPIKEAGMLGYRSEKYGWTYDIEFKIKDDRSGHTHWIYVGGDDNGINGFLVAGKQESLDFCKINATMHDSYFLPVSVSE